MWFFGMEAVTTADAGEAWSSCLSRNDMDCFFSTKKCGLVPGNSSVDADMGGCGIDKLHPWMEKCAR